MARADYVVVSWTTGEEPRAQLSRYEHGMIRDLAPVHNKIRERSVAAPPAGRQPGRGIGARPRG